MDYFELTISVLALVGGFLIGSSMVGPLHWIIDLGIPANLHFNAGMLLGVISIAAHLLRGGSLNPFSERKEV